MDDPLDLEGLEPRKRCTMCKQWKPLDQFHRNRTKKDGLQGRCKPCNIAINRQWYRDHPEARAARMDEYARRRKRFLQEQLLSYLRDHPCVDCGESDPVVLEFDHLRDKTANVTTLVIRRVAWSRVLAEIAKCEVVCANCHRRRTAARIGAYRHRLADDFGL